MLFVPWIFKGDSTSTLKQLFNTINNNGCFFISGLSLLESKEDLFQDWRQRFWTSYKVCIFTKMFLKYGNIYCILVNVHVFCFVQTGVVFWSTMQVKLCIHADFSCTDTYKRRHKTENKNVFSSLYLRWWTLPWYLLWHGQHFWAELLWPSLSTCVTSDSNLDTNLNELEMLQSRTLYLFIDWANKKG